MRTTLPKHSNRSLSEVALQRSSQISAQVCCNPGATNKRNRINSEGVRERFQRCRFHTQTTQGWKPNPGLSLANAFGVLSFVQSI
jgi:hypothetical protein